MSIAFCFRILFFLLFLPASLFAQSTVLEPIKIAAIISHQEILIQSEQQKFAVNQNLMVLSRTSESGIIGFVRITKVLTLAQAQALKKDLPTTKGHFYLASLSKQSPYNLIQVGDGLVDADLSGHQNSYEGSTELLVKKEFGKGVSLRYRPLFTQGPQIGETAQTLWHLETFITWYGLMYMGLGNRWTIGTWAPANFFKRYNFSSKLKIYDGEQNTVSTGLSLAKPDDTSRWTLNLNLMWDSFSSENLVTHTFATLAVIQIQNAQDTSAVKSVGTSALQTGYEFILPNWDRILLGPNYNFETKNIGGYLAYKMLWDIFALELSMYSTNIRSTQIKQDDGYSFFFDAYWRF